MLAPLLAAALAAQSPAPVPQAPDFRWMLGGWVSCTPERVAEEHWLDAGALGLAGVAVTRPRSGTASFEFARVTPHQGGWAFLASPGGAPPVAFPMTAGVAESATFENPANDFPKRIVYRRSGETLHATISNPDGPTLSWTYVRPGSATTCNGTERRHEPPALP